MRLWRGVALLGTVASLASATVALGSASNGASYQPIQGAWAFEGGTVLIQPASKHRFVGIVVRKTTFGTCTHPRGQRMWRIAGSGRRYAGTHLYFKKSLPCAVDRPGQATWTVGGTRGRQTLRFCSAEPGTGLPTPSNPTTLCHTLPRVPAPANVSRDCLRLSGSLSLCITGPAPLRSIGCLPRSRRAAAFTASLTGAAAAATKVGVGPFHLGRRRLVQRGRTIGPGHRVSFSARPAQFSPGPHPLRAIARPRGQRRTLQMTVWVCD
jgi:hypothetical protein